MNSFYIISVTIGIISLWWELKKYYKAASIMVRKKSASTTSRTYFFNGGNCIVIQLAGLIVGVIFGYNNLYPVILLLIPVVGNYLCFYLACKYKRTNFWTLKHMKEAML